VCDPQGACFEPECDEHGACEEAVCVDRRCAAAVVGIECAADGDCGPGQRCADVGACLPDGPCGEDANCPAGAPLCHLASGECRQCQGPDDCFGGELCWEGRCQAAGMCAADGDCRGGASCDPVFGTCAPLDGCAGDRLDGAEEPPVLLERVYSGLVLCDGTRDAYSFELGPSEGVLARLRFDPALGDLAVELVSQEGQLLASSDGLWGVEQAAAQAAQRSETVRVVVRGRQGAHVPYSLELQRLPPQQCPPDDLEGLLGNDTRQLAARLRHDEAEARLCPQETDWYSILLGAGSRTSFELTLNDGLADLEMELVNPDGVALAQGAVDDEGVWSLTTDVANSGEHALMLRRGAGARGTAYTLAVAVAPAPEAAATACADAPSFELFEALGQPAYRPVDRASAPCGPGGAPEWLATLHLEAQADVVVRLEAAAPGTSLALYEGCDLAGEPVGCVTDDEYEGGTLILSADALGAGDWTVLVDGWAAGPGPLLSAEPAE